MELLRLRYLGDRLFRGEIPVGIGLGWVGLQQAGQKESGGRNTLGHVNAAATGANDGDNGNNGQNFPI